MPKAHNRDHLPTLIVKDGQPFATSRDIAVFVAKDHKNIVQAVRNLEKKYVAACARARREDLEIPQGGLLTFQHTPYVDQSNGETYLEYVLDRNTAVALILGLNGERAMPWQLAYIAAFNEMEARLATPSTAVVTVQPTPAARVDMRDPSVLAKAFLQVTMMANEFRQRAEVAEVELEFARPKVRIADRIIGSKRLYCLSDAFKALEVRPKTGFTDMAAAGFIFRRTPNGPWIARQEFLDKGWFKATLFEKDNFAGSQTKITGEGIFGVADEIGSPLTKLEIHNRLVAMERLGDLLAIA